jgi:hypothetical protein
MSPEQINQYLQSAKQIIGERSEAEEAYDDEVVAGLEQGLPIKAAIDAANRKFPGEALKVQKEALQEVAQHFEYLAEHKKIMRRLGMSTTK